MLTRYRHRRGMYSLAQERRFPTRAILKGIIILVALYIVAKLLLRLFGFGGPIERLPAVLSVGDRGVVNVTLEGESTKRAEDGMKLFAGEKLSTGSNGRAMLRFFDASAVSMDSGSDLIIESSSRTTEDSTIALSLERGSIWISIPASSGALTHTLSTPLFSYTFPSKTEAIVSPNALLVLSASGPGVAVSAKGRVTIIIGEGQKLSLPSGATIKDIGKDLYAYRAPLDVATVTSTFLTESRALAAQKPLVAAASAGAGSDILTVRTPIEGAAAPTGIVEVTGSFGNGVAGVKVNGYDAILDTDNSTFSREVSIPEGEQEFALRIQAFDRNDQPITELQRTVHRGGVTASGAIAALPSPIVTGPAKTGETYRTMEEEVVLRGTSPAEAAALYVNDYKLQLFTPSKGTWSYLASRRLGNLKNGTNVFNVVAENANGGKSAPASITVIWGEQGTTASAASNASTTSALNPASLPKNDPLSPGSLILTGAAADPAYVASGTGFILEGKTSASTATLWVNDYQLQLYKAGKTFWNYIASPDLKTLKTGKNTFVIIARNAKGEILDRLEYTVEYK